MVENWKKCMGSMYEKYGQCKTLYGNNINIYFAYQFTISQFTSKSVN